MGWQEREVSVPEALSFLKGRQRKGNKLSRVHVGAQVDWVARTIALERGLCGRCGQLKIKLANVAGDRKGIALGCKSGEDPLDRHRPLVFDLGAEPPSCRFFNVDEK
jgi:hypothetical protein